MSKRPCVSLPSSLPVYDRLATASAIRADSGTRPPPRRLTVLTRSSGPATSSGRSIPATNTVTIHATRPVTQGVALATRMSGHSVSRVWRRGWPRSEKKARTELCDPATMPQLLESNKGTEHDTRERARVKQNVRGKPEHSVPGTERGDEGAERKTTLVTKQCGLKSGTMHFVQNQNRFLLPTHSAHFC